MWKKAASSHARLRPATAGRRRCPLPRMFQILVGERFRKRSDITPSGRRPDFMSWTQPAGQRYFRRRKRSCYLNGRFPNRFPDAAGTGQPAVHLPAAHYLSQFHVKCRPDALIRKGSNRRVKRGPRCTTKRRNMYQSSTNSAQPTLQRGITRTDYGTARANCLVRNPSFHRHRQPRQCNALYRTWCSDVVGRWG